MYATKIKMKYGCNSSQRLIEIDEIYIEGSNNSGFYKKAILHDHLKNNPGTIKVKICPYPKVIPAVSVNGEKYVRSSPNDYTHDDLLDLPRV